VGGGFSGPYRGQSIPTVEGTQRLANRPRGRIRLARRALGREREAKWKNGCEVSRPRSHRGAPPLRQLSLAADITPQMLTAAMCHKRTFA
jgi:hypothetical protein